MCTTCGCQQHGGEQNKSCCTSWSNPKFIRRVLGMLLIAAVVIVALVRDRIVNNQQWQVSVTGQGRVSYQPDIANVTVGVQIDKAATAELALNQLNDKITKVVAAVKAAGVAADDIQTQTYSLYPQYDYKDTVSKVSGYSANQQLTVKVRNADKKDNLVSKVLAEATKAGANQVVSVTFDVSNINDLKQQARLKAMADARSKVKDQASGAGVRLGKVIGWWENIIQAPGVFNPAYGGMGGIERGGPVTAPQVPSGTQEVIVEVSLNYRVK